MFTVLEPIYANVKSFYDKAYYAIDEEGITLYSYNTKVIRIKTNGDVEKLWNGSSHTTTRHIKEFLKQFS